MTNKIIKINSGKVAKTIGGKEVFIIAEIGKNFIQTEAERPIAEYLHNAKELIDAAAGAGVDAVKFQTHEIEDEIHPDVSFSAPHFPAGKRYEWVLRNTKATPLEFWQKLKSHAEKRGLIFFSTPMSRQAAEKLDKVGVPIWKVASGDMRDYALFDFMLETGKPLIISSGQVSLSELDEIAKHIRARGRKFALLYCISHYPCPPEYFNLATIKHFEEKYPEVVVGFSDHSIERIDIPLAAIKVGAKIIEKHFSLSRDLWGSDHKVSMTPVEMRELVKLVRGGAYKKVDHAPYYGEKTKELEGAKNQMRPYFGKALVAARDIPKGTTLTKEMIYAVRPIKFVKGLPAHKFFEVVGREVKTSLRKYQPITLKILKK